MQARASRLHRFTGAAQVEAVLDALAARTPAPFAARLDGPVRAGPAGRQALVDDLYDDGAIAEAEEVPPDARASTSSAAPTYAELAARVAELERRLAAASERQATGDDWPAPPLQPGRGTRPGGERGWREFPVDDDRALPAGSDEADGLLDRLADIERRVARIEAELGALR